MRMLPGVEVARRLEVEIALMGKGRDRPSLAIYAIGEDPSSELYVRSKVRKGSSLRAEVLIRRFPTDAEDEAILESIGRDSQDPSINGIVIERPLPEGLDISAMNAAIDPLKDLEAQSPENYGLLAQGRHRFLPPTPLGAVFLMLHYGIDPAGKNIAVIGRSPTVGTPLALMLSRKARWADGTVALIHSHSRDHEYILKNADIVITAVGRPRFLKGDMLRSGSHIIDLGISMDGSGKISGDADLASMDGIVSSATPTPGGTGSVTVSCMFLNLFRAHDLQSGTLSPHEDEMIRMIYT